MKVDLQNDPLWYAFYVKPRHEKKVLDRLLEKEVEVFVPLVKKLRQWSDRKKMVEVPLIKGYVFCKIPLRERLVVLQTPGVLNILRFAGKWSPIPEKQIESLKIVVAHPETLRPEKYFEVGTRVRVIEGPFMGAEGFVQRTIQGSRLIITIDGIRAAFSVAIQPEFLEVVGEKTPRLVK